jgi:hypothetical protein
MKRYLDHIAVLLAWSLSLSYKTLYMDPKQRLALMEKIIRELDDLKNSQISVLKKIAQIEADNINLEVGLLSDGLPDLHEEVDHGLQKVSALHEQFTEFKNKYETDNQKLLTETP